MPLSPTSFLCYPQSMKLCLTSPSQNYAYSCVLRKKGIWEGYLCYIAILSVVSSLVFCTILHRDCTCASWLQRELSSFWKLERHSSTSVCMAVFSLQNHCVLWGRSTISPQFTFFLLSWKSYSSFAFCFFFFFVLILLLYFALQWCRNPSSRSVSNAWWKRPKQMTIHSVKFIWGNHIIWAPAAIVSNLFSR